MNRTPIAPGLGRGLASLIPRRGSPPARPAASAPPSSPDRRDTAREVPTDRIVANPYQPRQEPEHGLDELAASIREHGILQPLVVQPDGDRYVLIAGERRLRAAQRLGLPAVPVVVRTATQQQQLALALVENLQRRNLNPVEEAGAYQRLIDEFNLTQERVAAKVGKSRSHVANTLRLRGLPPPILDSLRQGEIAEGHAKVLLALPSADEQLKLWREIVRRHVPVRGVEAAVRQKVGRAQPPDAVLDDLAQQIEQRYQTRVRITRRRGHGTITFAYFSAQELRALTDRLLKS